MILYTVYFVIFSASTKYRLLSLSQAITTPRLGVQRVRFLSVESSPCLYLVLIWPDLCHCALKRRFGEIWRARSLMHGWRTQSSSRELRRLINDWSMHINAASQTLRTELIIYIYNFTKSNTTTSSWFESNVVFLCGRLGLAFAAARTHSGHSLIWRLWRQASKCTNLPKASKDI